MSSKAKNKQQNDPMNNGELFLLDSLTNLSNSSDLTSLKNAITTELMNISDAHSAALYLMRSDQKSIKMVGHTGSKPQISFTKSCDISKRVSAYFKKFSPGSLNDSHPNKTVSDLINKIYPIDDKSAILPIPLTDDKDLIGLVFCKLQNIGVIANINFNNIKTISHLSGILLTNIKYCQELVNDDLLGWKIPFSKMHTSYQIKSLIDSFEECFFVVNMAGIIIDVNQRTIKRLKYRKSELINQPLLKLHPQEYHEAVQKTLVRILAGKINRYQIPLKTKTGSIFPVESQVIKGIWQGEEVLFGISQDLTDEKESEKKLRLIIDHTDQDVWMIDRNYQIIEFNESFAHDFEKAYQIKIKIGTNTIRELRKILPDLADEWQRRYDKALAGESFTEIDNFVIQSTDLFIESRFFPILSGEKVTGVSVFAKDVTQSKIAELALKASEEKYKMAFNYAAFGMVLTSFDSHFIDVNPYFCDMVGYSRDDLLSMKIDDIIYPEDRIIFNSRIQELFANRIPFLWLEFRFVHKRGFVQWGMISSTILRDEEGNPKFSISHIQDITKKRDAEKELRKKTRQQESILKTARHLTRSLEIKDVLKKIALGPQEILDSTSIAIYFLSDDHQTLYPVIAIDPKYKKEILATPLQVQNSFTGKAVTERRGIVFNDVTVEKIGHQIPGTPEEDDECIISTPFILDDEILGALTISRNGKKYTESDLSLAETYATYAATALKNARIYEALQKEVKDRKQAEYGLQELNVEYENFIQNNLVGIWKLKLSPPISINYSVKILTKKIFLNAFVADCNDAAAKMYHLNSKNEIINQPLSQLKISNRNWVEVIDQFIKNNYKMEMVDVKEIIDNEPYYFRYSFFGKVEEGHLTWIWGIQLDITNQKHLEEQLLQSQKMESIGTLAGGIAHDFNNLLTVINGHAELALMKTGKDSPVYKDLNIILEGGEKAGNLTRQLLAFSRKQIVKPKVLDLNQLILNMDKMLRRLLSEDITIETNFDPTIQKIKADPGQLEQILMNLVINARDAINEAQPLHTDKNIWITTKRVQVDESTLSANPELSAENYVVFSVRDNGIGMKNNVKEKIFEPFFTTKSISKGTGLGLATTYGIIRQNKGFIEVNSQYRQGSVFTIHWPVITQSKSEEMEKAKEKGNIAGSEAILFVEDDKAVREFATTALRELGYQVVEHSDGEAAFNYVQQNDPAKIDILITDIVMPKMNGKDLADKISKLNPRIKILFTSGYVDNHICSMDIIQNNANFLQKPYSIQVLAGQIREIMDKI